MRRSVAWVVVLLTLAAAVGSAETVTLRWATYNVNAAFEANMKTVAAAFEQENPDIKVQVEVRGSAANHWDKLRIEHVANTAPDIALMNVSMMPDGLRAGMFQDLTPYTVRDKISMKDYVPLALKDWTFDGKLYAGILSLAGEMFVYNRAIFSNAGLGYPTDKWTWDTMAKAAKKMTTDANGDALPDQFGFASVFTAYMTPASMIREAGGEVLNDARNASRLNEPAALKAVEYMVSMLYEQRSWVTPADSARKMYFGTGKVGMGRYGSWDAVAMRDNAPDLDWNFAVPPIGPSGVRNLQWGSNAWSMLSSGKNKEAAWKLMKYLISQPGQKTFGENGVAGLLPWLRSPGMLAKWPKQDYATLVESVVNYGHDYYNSEVWSTWLAAMKKEMDPVWAGQRSAKEGLERAHEAINQVFAGLKK